MTTPTTSTRYRPAEERRQSLLDAGLIVFTTSGVPAATVEDLTRAAGMSKGSFYLHFSTKEELARAVWERHMARFAEVGQRILDDQTAPIDVRLAHVLQALTRFAIEHGAVHRALYGVAGADAVKVEVNERLIQMIGDAAAEGVEAGKLSCEHPELLARALYHGYCGAAMDAIADDAGIDPDTLVISAGNMTRAVFPRA